MTKRVVISCTPSNIYDFFLPISVRLWRRVGYEPIVVLVGSKEDWTSGHAGIVYDEICKSEQIEFFQGIPGIPDSAVSMGLRQHVSALDLHPDDLLLVGDVDLFPMDRDFYHRHDPIRNAVGVYYAETYRGEYWPAYGVSMSVRSWREVMGVAVGDFRGSVEKALTYDNLLAAGLPVGAGAWDTRFWTFDERYATFKIRASRFSNDVALFPSTIGEKRPQRLKLPSQPYISDYVDFHCSRPGWTEENWPDVRWALAQALPDDLRWLDRYVDAYRRSLKSDFKVASDKLEATHLSWDSDVFGVRVGLLELEAPLPRTLAIIGANLGKHDVVFVRADGWHDPRGVDLVDHTYDMEFSGTSPGSDVAVVELVGAPGKSHIEIATSAFPDSRFSRDLRLAKSAPALYGKWLSGGGDMYALGDLINDAFLLVKRDADGAGRISLIAVFEKSRGIRIGEALVRGVMHRLKSLTTWRVRVSSRNVKAIRFYERLGFKVKSAQTVFHVWLTSDRQETA